MNTVPNADGNFDPLAQLCSTERPVTKFVLPPLPKADLLRDLDYAVGTCVIIRVQRECPNCQAAALAAYEALLALLGEIDTCIATEPAGEGE
jgi:hypothetical protein